MFNRKHILLALLVLVFLVTSVFTFTSIEKLLSQEKTPPPAQGHANAYVKLSITQPPKTVSQNGVVAIKIVNPENKGE